MATQSCLQVFYLWAYKGSGHHRLTSSSAPTDEVVPNLSGNHERPTWDTTVYLDGDSTGFTGSQVREHENLYRKIQERGLISFVLNKLVISELFLVVKKDTSAY